jgi:hypothetical protein
MIKVDINGIDFTSRVEIDLSFVEKLNRELDEGYISIPHSFRATPFSMFDIVDIYEDDELLFSGRISMDRVGVSSFNDRLFNHEISLVEHTKILEKYIVKGKTFTRPISLGATSAYTLLEVVEILRQTTPFELNLLKTSYRPFRIPQETIDLLDNIIAPEFNFKDLTLRQALDQVASVIDSIVRLDREGNLFLTQFDKLKDKISFVANDYKMNQNINDYSTTIESEMLNSVMGANDLENLFYEEVYPSERTFTTLRSNDYLFGFENLTHIPTPRPIYRVNDVRVLIFVDSVTSQTPEQFPSSTTLVSGYVEISIANRVLPFEVWNTLDVGVGVELIDRTKFFKNNTFYYKYGQKNIYVGESFGLFGIQTAVENTIKNAVIDHFINVNVIPPEMIDWEYENENGVLFRIQGVSPAFSESQMTNRGLLPCRVHYTPIPRSQRFQVERDTISEVNFYSETVVNQQTRLIDVEKYGNNLKGRINQMGNSIKQLSHRVGSPSETFDIGDFIEDDGLYVITQKEVIIHRNYTVANYELTRNFNNFSQFMGVDKEIRQSEVGESNRTVERDLLYKEYIEIDVTKDTTQVGENSSLTLNNTSLIINTLNKGYEHDFIKFGFIETNTISNKILVGVNKLSGGNTFGLSFELENNISAGNQLIEEEGLFKIANRSFNEPVKYANEQARFETLKFSVYHDEPDTIDFTLLGEDYQQSDRDIARVIADEAPIINGSIIPSTSPIIEGEWYVAKDNREIIKFTLLYPFLSYDHEKVIIGNKLVELNGLNRKGQNKVQLWLYENRRFDVSDSNKSLEAPDIVYDNNLSLTLNTTNNKITINNEIPSGYSWALVNDEGFPYLMSNTDDHIIIFNFRNKRSLVKYLGDISKFSVLVAGGIGTSTLDFTFTVFESFQIFASGIGDATLDFNFTFFESFETYANGNGQCTMNFVTAFYKKELLSSSIGLATLNFSGQPNQIIELVASGEGNAFFTSNDLQFQKQWVAKSVSPPYAVSIELGEVQACPTQQSALDLLQSQFPASNQNLGDKAFVGNAFTINPNTFDIFVCQDFTFEVEAV